MDKRMSKTHAEITAETGRALDELKARADAQEQATCRACGSEHTEFAFHRDGVWITCRNCDSVSAVAPADVIDDRSGFDEPGCHLRLVQLSKAVTGLDEAAIVVWGDQDGKFAAYCDAEGLTAIGGDVTIPPFEPVGAVDLVVWLDALAYSVNLADDLDNIARHLDSGGLLYIDTTHRHDRTLTTLAGCNDIRPASGHALIVTGSALHMACEQAGFDALSTLNDTTTLWRKR